MGLLDRIGRLVRANVNSLITQAEDPEKVLEATLQSLQRELTQVRQAVAQAIAIQKRTERQYAAAQQTAADWYRQAQLAVDRGEDGAARDALTRRQPFHQSALALGGQLNGQTQTVEQLRQTLRDLEQKFLEARAKRDLYVARARSAAASQRMNELLDRTGGSAAGRAFERLEAKVLDLEARSSVGALGSDPLEGQFAALEGLTSVDAELANLKAARTSNRRPPLGP
ncbi:MAG: PspA/IM30 family protein [Cyanophyceae cyanobacterium]